MIFGEAIEALKEGRQIARSGWNGKGMYLFLICPDKGDIALNASMCDADLPIRRFIMMKTAQNDLVPWLASQTDVLADDWVRV